MNALKSLAVIALIGICSASNAQSAAQPTTVHNVHVYMVGKQDAQHILLTEVMEVPSNITREALMERVRTAHPGVTIPENTEGLEFGSAGAAEQSRQEMKATHERAGRTVTLLDAK